MIKEFAYKLPNGSSDSLNKKNLEVRHGKFINKPQFNLGFQYFLQTRKT